MENERKIIYKCSNPECSFEQFLKVDAIIVCPDGKGGLKNLKMGDTCFICNEGTMIGDELDREIDPIRYPTLAKYQPRQIWDAVVSLKNRFPDMSEEQSLLNLEMDLAEKEQLARGY